MTVPDPPDISSINPRMMTAAELQRSLEQLFGWLQTVEASPAEEPDVEMVQSVRDAANALLQERRDRHSDEPGFRGG